jgi:hypothetical protein
VGQGEDDVEVWNGQQIGRARRQPPLFGERLALRTVAIATGNGVHTVTCHMGSDR